MIKGEKILITGATGSVARPIAITLAKDNEVWCLARFGDPGSRAELEAHGIKTFTWSLETEDFTGLPDDFAYAIHAAADIFSVANDYDQAIARNAEGTAMLMQHCRKARAFLFVSSIIVYKPPKDADDRADERTAPLGAEPSAAKTYSIMKIATESAVRAMARTLKLPTTIARLGMVYGVSGRGGAPTIFLRQMLAGQPLIHGPEKRYYSPISEADVLAHIEPLLNAASVPANIINWSGDEALERAELYDYLAALTGIEPIYAPDTPGSSVGGLPDVSRLKAIAGPYKNPSWREGVLESLKANFPDVKFREPPQ